MKVLASLHPEYLLVVYSLTGKSVPESWVEHRGHDNRAMVASALSPPMGEDSKTMILVYGTDGFVATWACPVGCEPKRPDRSKGSKIQGPLLGLLKEADYTAEEVFKYLA
jgi:hypothetical protein